MKSLIALLIVPTLIYKVSAQTGCIVGDCYNGIGTYIWDDGSEYTGQWLYGARTGLGVFDWPDGSYYYGYFENGVLEGRGFYLAKEEEDDLIGTFHDGKLSTSGSFATSGCLLGDCTNGIGIYLWESNDIYMGEWLDGVRTGYGRYDWADGSLYTGHFKDNLLDGKGTYVGKDGNEMTGEFIKNEFQKTSATGSRISSETPLAKSPPVTADFCTIIRKVTDDYTKNFQSLMGEKEPDNEFSMGDIWASNAKVSGSVEAKVSQGWLGAHNTWYSVLYETSSQSDAYSKYQEYVKQMQDCSPACCVMAHNENKYEKETYKSYTSSWLTFLLNDGYDESYEEMLIEIEMSSSIVSQGFEVVARVKEFKRD